MEQVLTRLKQEGWALDEQAAAAFLQDAFPGSAAPSASAAAEALLNADLRQLGAGGLPDDVNRAPALKLAGPIVLQVSDARDIAQPSRTASESSERHGRLLRLALTDGKARCVALELQPLPLSAEQLIPGTKLALSGVTVRLGVLLLEPRNVRLLGGRVDALAEAWETQRRYGGTAVERPEAADAARPPPFRHFDPKLAKYGSRRGAVARAAAAAAPAPPSGDGPLRQPTAAAASAEGSKAPRGGQEQQQQQPPPRGQQQREGRVRRGAQPYQPPAARQPQQPPQPVAQHEQHEQQQQQPAAQQREATEPQLQHKEHQGQGRQPAAQGSIAGPPQQAPPPAAAPAAGRPGGAAPAAAQKLLERLQVEEGRYGRGQPRRRRRSRYDDDDEDDGSMTLEEWEARQKGGGGGGAGSSGGAGLAALDRQQHGQQGQPLSDEELARQLQRQLDLEAAAEWGTPLDGAPADDIAASLQAMFAYGGGGEEGREGGGRGGRGRGRGRGRR